MSEEPRQESKVGTSWTRLSGIGFELAAAVAGFTLTGYWWDRHFGTGPWGVLTGAVLGLVGGMYNLIRKSLRITKKDGRT
jgi:F0F1-type ATP synthase assembly protein I